MLYAQSATGYNLRLPEAERTEVKKTSAGSVPRDSTLRACAGMHVLWCVLVCVGVCWCVLCVVCM